MKRVTLPAIALLFAASVPAAARAGEKHSEHLLFSPTYAGALMEARVRNVPVFVSRHKDECGRCRRLYAKVFEDRAFVRWANEHLVVLVAHNEMLHDAVEVEGEDGEVEERCPLYPGMTCRQHVHAAVDIDTARGEDLVKVPFVELCPNSWLVLPTDEVLRIEEKDQFDPERIREIVEARQKDLGPALGREASAGVIGSLVAYEGAQEDGKWHDALSALAAVVAAVPDPAPPLKKLVDERLALLDEDLEIEVVDIVETGTVDDELRASARALIDATDVKVRGEHLPARGPLVEWLARNS